MLAPGEYYPRIGRGYWRHHDTSYGADLTSAHLQLGLIIEELKKSFEYIEPTTSNLNTYGHRIRNALMVACTEFEAQCVAVLQANSYAPVSGRFSTQDYVELNQVMLLDEYVMGLRRYPNLPEQKPFEGWDAASPTQSLPWYDAYNKVKHDREANFSLATVGNLVSATTACAIMHWAQLYGVHTAPGDALHGEFVQKNTPAHSEQYNHEHGVALTEKPYPF